MLHVDLQKTVATWTTNKVPSIGKIKLLDESICHTLMIAAFERGITTNQSSISNDGTITEIHIRGKQQDNCSEIDQVTRYTKTGPNNDQVDMIKFTSFDDTDDSMVWSKDVLPQGLKRLLIDDPSEVRVDLARLPDGLEQLRIGDCTKLIFTLPGGELPPSLNKLFIRNSNYYELPIVSLPMSLTTLRLEEYEGIFPSRQNYNININNNDSSTQPYLPLSIQSLYVPVETLKLIQHNWEINLPNLVRLAVSSLDPHQRETDYHQLILPTYIKKLKLNLSIITLTDYAPLPTKLISLKLSGPLTDTTIHPSVLPESLVKLRIQSGNPQLLPGSLPSTLTHLVIRSGDFNHPLPTPLPSSLKVLKLPDGYSVPIPQPYPPNLTRLRCGFIPGLQTMNMCPNYPPTLTSATISNYLVESLPPSIHTLSIYRNFNPEKPSASQLAAIQGCGPPNIKHLVVSVINHQKTIPIHFDTLVHLETLMIRFKRTTSSSITTLDKRVFAIRRLSPDTLLILSTDLQGGIFNRNDSIQFQSFFYSLRI
ncbi:hypothetical protein DFA_12290 [Cavenderia fasciculata]|uniref:FNIP repeat-containing protein n=1 Tax=Cavenderia fasciculata TaxID=261658 RepID=F4QD43_CACFS|nr:uncharacterized protein DFA_12290 [Cavenderia fasciculata]EGG14514.1 hypothetical protein DFA_12290 [Cavenderia fasciculata]|eukprot:XP_004353931.1 hypothetical protein DFA_12290 [Cavenderia fasciculata]